MKKNELIALTKQKEENHKMADAICLYTDTQHHFLHAGEDLKSSITYEHIDRDN